MLIAVFVLLAASVHACVIHLPQLFADRGATPENAALASSVVGLALLVGRIGCGYFLDRYFGARVALVLCLSAALDIALLWTGSARGPALAGAFLVGLGMGAESEYLRSDVPGSVRPVLIFRGSRYYFSPFTEFLFSLETGIPARDKVLGKGTFEYLRATPQEERVFDDAMTAISALWAPAIAEVNDFGHWETLTDVGGGNGVLLAAILRAHPALMGVLADAPSVVERARRREFLSGELAARTRCEPCDFFQTIPSGSRAYLMKHIIHDWNDAQVTEILRNCRRAVPDDGALVLIEYCLGDDNTPSVGKTLDLIMLTITGGKERTVEEHPALLASAGFQLNRTISISAEIMMLEAFPTAAAGARSDTSDAIR